MTKHPTTPADEADLRVVLSRQSDMPSMLVDVRGLQEDVSDLRDSLFDGADGDPRIVVFDTLTESHLSKIGLLLEDLASTTSPLFSVGSSAVESALTSAWATKTTAPQASDENDFSRVLILVGSCSPVTQDQVAAAKRAGAPEIRLDTNKLSDTAVCGEVAKALARHAVVVVSTGQDNLTVQSESLLPAVLGEAFSRIVRECVGQLSDGLLVIAGGDTASHTVKCLGVESLTMEAPFVPGAPVCRASAPGKAIDGLALVLKGGQVGKPDLFEELTKRTGEAAT